MRQEEVDSDYLFANFLQLPAFRSAPCPAGSFGSRSSLHVEFAVMIQMRIYNSLQASRGW